MSGVRDMAGGVIAVALVLCVGVIIIGCVSLIPDWCPTTRMERAFSWKRLLAAMLRPVRDRSRRERMGLELQRVRLQRVGREPFLHAVVRQWETNLKDGRGKGDDSLTGLVKQLGDDIVSGISDTVKTTVKGAVDDAFEEVGTGLSAVTARATYSRRPARASRTARPAYGNG